MLEMYKIFLLLFVILAVIEKSQGLSRINIELKSFNYQYLDSTPLPAVEYEQLNQPEESSKIGQTFVENEKPKPVLKKLKKKKKRKTKRKPKKMNLRRIFKTRIITTTPRQYIENDLDATTTEMINLAPIYDTESGVSYTKDELDKLCTETVTMSRNFGITDIDTFAKNNCFIIRMYYPNVTCSQINQLIDYCTSNGLING